MSNKTVNATTYMLTCFFSALTITFMAFMFTMCLVNWMDPEGNGIYAHESGQAAYIAGEACVINMEKDTVVNSALNEQYIWCTIRHNEFLAEGVK